MKCNRTLTMILVICLGAWTLSGCGTRQTQTEDKMTVGIAYYDKSDTFINALNACLLEELQGMETDQLKITTTILDAAGSQRTQNDQVEELIDMGCNVLCVNLVDRSDPSEIIDLAMEHQVPIIFYNREPVAEDMRQWDQLYYVGADARQSGEMQGELAADAIKANSQIDRNKDGKIQYVVLEGEPGHQDSIIRTENAVDTLEAQGIKLEKLTYQIANWSRAQAENRMEQMIGKYHEQIELVLANNDDMALGALDAYEKLNYSKYARPLFLGIDGTKLGLQGVLDSQLYGTVYNDKEGQAQAMAKLAAAIVQGEGMEQISFTKDHYIFLPYEKITGENARGFMRK